MSDPVTLVILLAAGEAASATTSSMVQGAHDAFAGTATEVRETAGAPTDADALAAEEPSHPDAVAELLWRDPDHRHATLRVHLRQSHRWIERSFAFAASDPGPERGRTLGFAVASILPEATRPSAVAATAPAPAAAPTGATTAPATTATPAAPLPAAATTATAPSAAPPSAPTPAPAPASAPSAPPAGASASSAPGSSTAHAPTARADEGPPSSAEGPARDARLGVDLLGAGALGGAADAAGGGGALEWFADPRLSLRLGAIARAGGLDVAQAHVSTVVTSAGVVLHVWRPARSEPVGVTLRADYILVRESATHFDSDDPRPVTAARWVSGVDTFIDGTLLLSSQIAAIAGVGLEDVWAPTYIYFKDAHVATLPVLRAVAEAGFQLRF